MVISHRINGEDIVRQTFKLESSFDDGYFVDLPRYTEEDRRDVLASSARAISSHARKNLLERLGDFQPSQEAIELASHFTGMSIPLIAERIVEGRALARS